MHLSDDVFSSLPQIVTAAPQKFKIDILPVDDGTPRIVTNLGLHWLEYMENKVRDRDTDRNDTMTFGHLVTTEGLLYPDDLFCNCSRQPKPSSILCTASRLFSVWL